MLPLEALGLPAPLDKPGEEDALYLRAGMAWVEENTRYRFGEEETPPGVRLFLVKYLEVMQSGLASGVHSESLGGMSQRFSSAAGANSTASAEDVLRMLAGQLLGPWYSAIQVCPAQPRWR